MESNIQAVYNSFPQPFREKLLTIRDWIFDLAEAFGIEDLQECLKWGEPSYTCRKGSTIRVAWSTKHPDLCGVYFNCNSSLVETFRELYPDSFTVSGNRALLFTATDPLPEKPLRHCLSLALRYHQLKHRPLLGG